ncbi:MAG: hypothetical protein ACOC2H_03590, partial [Spirochaetota bacterium]
METDKEKRIERRAKNMILNKEIPYSKMEAVRSLLKNSGLSSNEKYSAVIQLIKDCPDKPVMLEKEPSPRISARTETTAPVQSQRSTMKQQQLPPSIQPSASSTYVDQVHEAYRPYNLFRKRYLIHTDNILKFWFKKRLVPNRRFFKVMGTIVSYQEKILYRLPAIMKAIVEDPEIEDPTVYNYLRILRKWMLDNPFIKLGYSATSWLDSRHFESELANYIQHYFGFHSLDAELKEFIILTVENKVRELEQADNPAPEEKLEGSTRSLKHEKAVYEYMMTLRSFIHNQDAGKGLVDTYLSSAVGTATLHDFLVVLAEALVFKRRTTLTEIKAYFNTAPLAVNRKQWECSNEYLKKAGKDPESLRKHRIDVLKKKVAPYDGIAELINLKIDGKDFLSKAFDEHWHIINKRRNEYANYADDSFFYFIDDCIDYFSHAYLPYLDGSTRIFIDPERKMYESSIFTRGYFEAKLSRLSDLQRDLLEYRTQNPNEMITYDEVKKILSGRLSTMLHIKSYLNHTGSLFYDIGSELFRVYLSHRKWIREGKEGPQSLYRTPLAPGTLDEED